jgi:predicted deacetylase
MPLSGALAVAIHDVEPRSFHRTQEIRGWLTERGIDRVTMLVIPASELHPIGPRAPRLIDWLLHRTDCGDAIAQHGLVHRATFRAPWPRSVLAGFQGGRAAEFPGLDPEATRHRVEMGLRLLREAELEPAGFVAPGYAYTRALRDVLSGPGFTWFADLGGVDTRCRGRIRARALCLGNSTPLKPERAGAGSSSASISTRPISTGRATWRRSSACSSAPSGASRSPMTS